MVKRVEITYEGGHKEVLHYTQRYNQSPDGILIFGFYNKRIEVNMNRVLQLKEL